jgi:hypothetical protein
VKVILPLWKGEEAVFGARLALLRRACETRSFAELHVAPHYDTDRTRDEEIGMAAQIVGVVNLIKPATFRLQSNWHVTVLVLRGLEVPEREAMTIDLDIWRHDNANYPTLEDPSALPERICHEIRYIALLKHRPVSTARMTDHGMARMQAIFHSGAFLGLGSLTLHGENAPPSLLQSISRAAPNLEKLEVGVGTFCSSQLAAGALPRCRHLTLLVGNLPSFRRLTDRDWSESRVEILRLRLFIIVPPSVFEMFKQDHIVPRLKSLYVTSILYHAANADAIEVFTKQVEDARGVQTHVIKGNVPYQ